MSAKRWLVFVVVVAIIVVIVVSLGGYPVRYCTGTPADCSAYGSNTEACAAAGCNVAESFPEQCVGTPKDCRAYRNMDSCNAVNCTWTALY